MKKVLKLGLTCIIMLSTIATFSNRIYAAESSNVLNIQEFIQNIDESDDQTQTNNNTTQNDTNNSKIPEIPDTSSEQTPTPASTPTPESTQEQKPQTNPEPESIKEENLPQTGEAENYILIVAAFAFGGIAIYAYRKNKKYNV